jgi:hypothetical protein
MAKFSQSPKLPDKPSELIQLALKDLAQVERMKKTYRVNMGYFHDLIPDSYLENPEYKCLVCFAGSVMARTLKCDPKKDTSPRDFDIKTGNKLRALDYFRCGNIVDAFGLMGINLPELVEKIVSIDDYATHPVEFKSQMRKLAKDLKEIGY